MNFISHYFLDQHSDQTDSFFFVGISTPDLISNFDRRIRLKAGTLSKVEPSDARPEADSFFKGVVRHFEVDRIFHSSDFFYRETHFLAQLLRERFGDQVKRSNFVAHILLELILDRVLILRHNDLLFSFYSHFERSDVPELVELTEWIVQQTIPGYGEFLEQFAQKRFLYRYVNQWYLIRVLKGILAQIGIRNATYLDSEEFMTIFESYEQRLEYLSESALEEFSHTLLPRESKK